MTGSAAGKAAEAADVLLGWLNGQAARRSTSSPAAPPETGLAADKVDDSLTGPLADPAVVNSQGRADRFLDRQAVSAAAEMNQAMRLPTPDWLHHRLTISGTAAEVGRFRQAAAGAGVIPWHLDLERMEEGYFHLLVASENRSLSVAGARIFARQLRDAVGRWNDLAAARVGHSQACPFDLHALLPVPTEILLFGPDEPRALAWLWEHWGTTEALRHVAEEVDRVPAYPAEGDGPEEHLRVSFWSADWTPWRALKCLKSVWPTLRFEVRSTYNLT